MCQLSHESINDSIDQFLLSTLVTADIIPENAFYARIATLVQQSKANAPITFARLLSIIQAMNHGNAIISAYGTNYQYIIPANISSYRTPFGQAIIYSNDCSCGLNTTCTTQATFLKMNTSDNQVQIKGFKMGCTPSESFLDSTLECFHDLSCINIIQQYTNYRNKIDNTENVAPLVLNESHFSVNATVKELANALFIEEWSTAINYSAYFEQCAPSLCSYIYVQQFDSIYTATFLVGIYGGLTIALKLICPWFVRFIAKTHALRKRRINSALAHVTISPTTSVTTSDDLVVIPDISIDVPSLPAILTTRYVLVFEALKKHLDRLLLGIVILHCLYTLTNLYFGVYLLWQ